MELLTHAFTPVFDPERALPAVCIRRLALRSMTTPSPSGAPPRSMRSLWRCCARARIDTALAGDRVAPFITNKVLNEVDDDVRQMWVRMPTGWNYQMTLARVVALVSQVQLSLSGLKIHNHTRFHPKSNPLAKGGAKPRHLQAAACVGTDRAA